MTRWTERKSQVPNSHQIMLLSVPCQKSNEDSGREYPPVQPLGATPARGSHPAASTKNPFPHLSRLQRLPDSRHLSNPRLFYGAIGIGANYHKSPILGLSRVTIPCYVFRIGNKHQLHAVWSLNAGFNPCCINPGLRIGPAPRASASLRGPCRDVKRAVLPMLQFPASITIILFLPRGRLNPQSTREPEGETTSVH